MRQAKSEPHDVLFFVFIDDVTDFCDDLDCPITDLLRLIVQKLFNQRENSIANFLIRIVTEVLQNQLNQWNKLVQERLLHILSVISKEGKRRQKAVDVLALLLVGKVQD